MKKIYLILFALIALAGCGREKSFEQEFDSGSYMVTLNVRGASLPEYEPISAFAAEYTVSDLHVLFFDAVSDRYCGYKNIDMSVIQPASSSNEKYDAGFKVTIDMSGTVFDEHGSPVAGKSMEGKHMKFVFVANLGKEGLSSVLSSLSAGKNLYTLTLDDFKNYVLSSEIKDNHFIMLGKGTNGSEVGGILHKDSELNLPAVELQRIPSKIMVLLGKNPRNKGLSITKVTMKNRIVSSYLYEKPGNPGGRTHLLNKENKEYFAGFDKLYTYENGESDNGNSTSLIVELSLNGTTLPPVDIPFKGKSVKRNHVYRVTLNRNTGGGEEGRKDDITTNSPAINFTIDVNVWEKNNSYHHDNYDQSKPVITGVAAYNSDWSSELTGDSIKHKNEGLNSSEVVTTINSIDAYNLKIHLSPINTRFCFKVKEGTDRVTVKEVTMSSPVYGMLQEFNVEVKPYKTNEQRICVIEFCNEQNPEQKSTVIINRGANEDAPNSNSGFSPGNDAAADPSINPGSPSIKPDVHVLRFHANDGMGTVKEYLLGKGETMICPNVNTLFTPPANRGSKGNWNYSPEREGIADVVQGTVITMENKDIDLYAIWYIVNLSEEKQKGSSLFKNVEKFVDGIMPPSYSEWKQVDSWPVTDTYIGKTVPWKEGYGFYDVMQYYYHLCWAASASNVLHWWMDRNKENIKRYGKFKGDISYDIRTEDSGIFRYFKQHWPNRGNSSPDAFQWYLRGTDNRDYGGFFADVIKKEDRIFDVLRPYKSKLLKGKLALFCEEALKNGDMLGLAMDSHQYTVWGVDFDNDGYAKGLFVTDSRDFPANKTVGSKQRPGLKYIDLQYDEKNFAYTPTSMGGKIYLRKMQSYSQCKEYWERYFANNP